MGSKIECSICENKDPTVPKVKAGYLTLCEKCVILCATSQLEEVESEVKFNSYKPWTYKDKPATCKIFLYSYFQANLNPTVH